MKCGDCNAGMQSLRNCSGRGSPAKIELNGQLYRRCPRATYLENLDARFLVNLYFSCREGHYLPVSGSVYDQTAFTMELFDYLDGIVAEARARHEKEQLAEARAASQKRK